MTVRNWLTKVQTFDGWMAIAEIIDALRIFPRALLIYVVTFICYDMLRLSQFFFDLPSADKAQGSVVAFVTVVTGIDGALLTAVFALYNASSRDWSAYHMQKRNPIVIAQPPPNQTTVTVNNPPVGGPTS